jgi:hypothetical protein
MRAALLVGAPALLIGVLVWPMLFTSSGIGGDWEHHLWYVWQQSLAVHRNLAPSLFLNTPYSVFYPHYLFYGATINALTAALSLLPASTPTTAYVGTYILSFAAAYGGWYWAARIAGLGRIAAQAPALVYITSTCYLTLIYGEGDWPALLASSMMPLMVAAGLSVLRAKQASVLPSLALAGSTIIFFGSHNITILWGSTVLAATGLLVVVCVPEARRLLEVRSLIRFASVFLPAALVNSWFLLPTIAYASHTKIASEIKYLDQHYTIGATSFDQAFSLSRATSVAGTPDYALALPTLVIAWVLVSLVVVLWSVRRGSWVRVLLIFCAVTAAIVATMTRGEILSVLPEPYTILQFGYRLDAYILLGVTAAVLATLVLIRAGSQRLRLYGWTIVPALIVSVIGAVQQVNAYQRTPLPRSVTFSPGAEVFAKTYNDYTYAPLPLIYGKPLPRLEVAPAAIRDNRFSGSIRMRPGQLVYTNIGGGPDLLHITGAEVVGRDPSYHLVLAMGPNTAIRSAHPTTALATEHLTIAPAETLPVVLGRLLSLGSIIVLAGELAWLLTRRLRKKAR